MSQKLRFKRKTYGRGWTPATRQGRLVVIIYLVLDIGRVVYYSKVAEQDQLSFPNNPDAGGNMLILMLPIAIITIALLIISYHTGEKPKRQRGKQKE